MAGEASDPFEAAREALRHDSPLWTIQHLDITCDGCEQEPIVGHRCEVGSATRVPYERCRSSRGVVGHLHHTLRPCCQVQGMLTN